MPPPRAPRGDSPVRRFFLARAPGEGGPPTLVPEDAEHALRVLRLGPGDRLVGLDGRGRAWRLEVAASDGRRRLELRTTGEPPVEEPRPGDAGSTAPHLELACPLPRGPRAERLVEELTRLGVAAFTPLVTERTESAARAAGTGRRDRLERAVREACKQSGRSWLLDVGATETLDELLGRVAGRPLAVLDPRGDARLFDWANELFRSGPSSRPVVVLGPEGGLTPSEEARLASAGARRLRAGPHVLRIETAACAAAAVVAAAFG